MERELRWSPEASDDLEAISEFIARDSGYYARATVSRVLQTARDVLEHPFLGRVVPEIGHDQVRERFVYSYRLIYEVKEAEILILAVIHGKRLLDNFASRFE